MSIVLRVAIERCNGCGNCEMACAFAHANGAGLGQPRIHVLDRGASPRAHATPILCLQCGEAACVAACPVHALARNDETGAIEVTRERCIGCRTCVGACPFGNVSWDTAAGEVAKCDLCGGNPQCARFCPTGALVHPSPGLHA